MTDTESTGQLTDIPAQHSDACRGCDVWARRTRHTVVRGEVFA